MFRLFDLPRELLDVVLDKFVELAALHDVFHARAVCKLFADYFSHKLLANTPASTYNNYLRDVHPPFWWKSLELVPKGVEPFTPITSPYGFLHANAATFLCAHTLRPRGVQMKYPNFINQVANDLVKIAKVGEEDVVAVREAYVCDLSRAFVSLNGALNYLLTEYDEKNPPWGKEASMSPITETATDSMAASAAVGNIDTIHHFSDAGGRALELVTTEVNGTTCLHSFHNPLMAAARTGQFEAVRVLLQLAENDLPAFRERQLDPDNSLLDRLEKAITLAIKANNFQCALAILAFARKNAQPSHDHHLRGRTLVRAIKYGCLDVLKSILQEKKSDDSHHTEHSKEGICHALICDRSNIVRYLLTENILSFLSNFGLERDHRLMGTPMDLAVKFGHSVIIDILLEAGDVLRPSHLVIALTNILNKKSDNMRAAFFTIHHLIKKGAVLDRYSLEVFEGYAGKILRLRYNKEVHVNITNAVMTVVLVAGEIRKHFSREMMKS